MEIVHEILDSNFTEEEKYHQLENLLIAIQLKREILLIEQRPINEENEKLIKWYSSLLFETKFEIFLRNMNSKELSKLIKNATFKISCVCSRNDQDKDEIFVPI